MRKISWSGLTPQKGQWDNCPINWRARVILNVAIDWGLCRSGRTRRPSRAEVRRLFRG